MFHLLLHIVKVETRSNVFCIIALTNEEDRNSLVALGGCLERNHLILLNLGSHLLHIGIGGVVLAP